MLGALSTKYKAQLQGMQRQLAEAERRHQHELQAVAHARHEAKMHLTSVADHKRMAVVAATAARRTQECYQQGQTQLQLMSARLDTAERQLARAGTALKQEQLERQQEREAHEEKAQRLTEALTAAEKATAARELELAQHHHRMLEFDEMKVQIQQQAGQIKELSLKNQRLQTEIFEVKLVAAQLTDGVGSSGAHDSLDFHNNFLALVLDQQANDALSQGGAAQRIPGVLPTLPLPNAADQPTELAAEHEDEPESARSWGSVV